MNTKVFKLLEYDKIIEIISTYAHSDLGRQACLSLQPSIDYTEVAELLQKTDEALSIILTKPSHPLCGFSDISLEISRLNASSPLNCGELLRLNGVFKAARLAQNNIGHESPSLHSMSKRLFYDEDAIKAVDNAIISETEVSDSASPALRAIRRKIASEHESIREKLQSVIKNPDTSKYLMEDIVTLRGGRYVVPVRQEFKGALPGIVHDQSGSGQTLFVEPMAVVESNNRLRVLEAEEKAEIERILLELSKLFMPYCTELRTDLLVLVELDIIFSKAQYSKNIKGVLPKLNDEGILNIKSGRHPLLNKETVVPVSIAIGGEYRGLIITGPNTGGKTVTLKLAGLLQLLMQTGVFVSAEFGTQMCVFQKVFADIGDEQSIEQSLSTFSSHMKNIIDITENADEHSLVLLDELGAGTDPSEGAALSIAILEEMKYFGATVLATTHYSEIKAYALSENYYLNAGMEFDLNTLSPTYKLFMGIPGMSNAFLIAGRLGLPNSIIERAKTHLSEEHKRFEAVLERAEQERLLSVQKKEQLDAEYALMERERQESAQKLERAQQKSDEIIEKAKEKANDLLREARDEMESLISELKQKKQQDHLSEREITDAAQTARERHKHQSAKYTKKRQVRAKNQINPNTLLSGEDVFILSVNTKGTVLTLPDAKGNLTVMAGMMKLNVNISELERLQEPVKLTGKREGSVSLKNEPAKLSVDVRGLDLESALMEVDKYLDTCALQKLTEVTIIHGKGTGVLMKGIRTHLRGHRHVSNARAGMYGEGEMGVTVVTLK